MQFFTDLEAVEVEAAVFASRNLKLQNIDALFESTKFEKFKGSKSLNVCKTNILVITDKVISLGTNFVKTSVILANGFYYCFHYYCY